MSDYLVAIRILRLKAQRAVQIVAAMSMLSWTSSMQADEAKNPLNEFDRPFVTYAQPVIAITHARLIDGTGAPERRDVTVIIRHGRIASISSGGRVPVPRGAAVLDGTGKTLIPGFVMVHEHMFYPTGMGQTYGFEEFPFSFSRLYLAGGTTTLRTGGSMAPAADINTAHDIELGRQIGPDIDATGPYLDGPDAFSTKMMRLKDPDDAARTVNYWATEGATSFKAYIGITRSELQAAVAAAHAHHLKITGHLCSVTYAEAAEIGIDNIEHGFFEATDFVTDKQADSCPEFDTQVSALVGAAADSPQVTSLFQTLIAHHVAVTSTLPVFEGFAAAGRPGANDAALSLLTLDLREEYYRRRERAEHSKYAESDVKRFEAGMRLEKAFSDAGGILIAGTDPTGYGGTIPGFSAKREIELLVEEGFSIPSAIRIATLAGARYLERDKDVGSLEVGKRADIVVVEGDLASDITVIERMPLVFKAGIGYLTQPIFEAFRGKVGLY